MLQENYSKHLCRCMARKLRRGLGGVESLMLVKKKNLTRLF